MSNTFEIIYNCQQCGDEINADEAIKSFQCKGHVTCKCCNEPSHEDREEFFAYLVESKQVIVAQEDSCSF